MRHKVSFGIKLFQQGCFRKISIFHIPRQSMNNSSEPQDHSTTQLATATNAWVLTGWPLQCLHLSLRTELQKMADENPK